MRKQENLDLIKKLAYEKIDTSSLRASTTLGVKASSISSSSRRRANEAGSRGKANQSQDALSEDEDDESDSSNTSSELVEERLAVPSKYTNISTSSFGSGLKRSANNDDDELTIAIKRRRKDTINNAVPQDSELSWDGFSSSDDSERHSSPSKTQEDAEVDSVDGSEPSEPSVDSEESSESDEDPEVLKARRERSSAFKAWATQQVNEAMDFTPSGSASNAMDDLAKVEKPHFTPRPPEIDPLPPELSTNANAVDRKAFSVKVERSEELQEARMKLPIVAEEQKIMEAIFNNRSVVIWGATGSGKTTQVPQFLFEAGFGDKDGPYPGLIGVTQPRRVAAVSMAKRVSEELGDAQGRVSYQIRFDSSVSDKTAIKFMTDGILLREISNDFSLSKYSVIIIDEAHERSTNTDILIGMVSRIVDLRETLSRENGQVNPLKLIIMSATLRITDFLENTILFRDGPPPLIQAEGRQFPVITHFARRTQRDYIEEAYQKISRGHKRLPPGGILVFLTGQNEIMALSKKLREGVPTARAGGLNGHQVHITAKDAPLETEDIEFEDTVNGMKAAGDLDEEADDFDSEDDLDFDIDDQTPASSLIYILPLCSQLQTKDQLRVFQPPPANTRLIVLATNIAETSLTIPGIRYVFDTGRAKSRVYDQATGVQSFEIGWISKASAEQRAGRAGRTASGHCYRLYSSAVYERDFEEHADPEILRTPIEGVVLQLKSMNLQHVANFPFPTPPDRQSLVKAEKLLKYLGAITVDGKLSSLGNDLSLYPLSPRFAKMISIGHQHNCMPYAVALVAALATAKIFIPENQLDLSVTVRSEDQIYTNEDRLQDDARAKRKSAYNYAHHLLSVHSSTSDAMKLLTALCAHAHAADKAEFCASMFLSQKAVSEAQSLVGQLSSIVHSVNPSIIAPPSKFSLGKLTSPSKVQVAALQQFVAAGFIDQIAILASEAPNAPSDLGRKASRAIDAPYIPLFPISHTQKTEMDITDIAVYIHPSSILAHCAVKQLPTYIVYHHLQRAAPSTISDTDSAKRTKTRMHPLAAVTGRQLASLARGTILLEYGKPIGKIEEPEVGRKRTCWVIPNLVGEKRGGLGWPLPAVRVVQVKTSGGSGWQVESVIE